MLFFPIDVVVVQDLPELMVELWFVYYTHTNRAIPPNWLEKALRTELVFIALFFTLVHMARRLFMLAFNWTRLDELMKEIECHTALFVPGDAGSPRHKFDRERLGHFMGRVGEGNLYARQVTLASCGSSHGKDNIKQTDPQDRAAPWANRPQEYVITADLLEMAYKCPCLKKLDLSDLTVEVTDEVMDAVAQNCRGLEVLHLRRCNKITDKSLQALSQIQFDDRGCYNLRDINVAGCNLLTPKGLLEFARSTRVLYRMVYDSRVSMQGQIEEALRANRFHETVEVSMNTGENPFLVKSPDWLLGDRKRQGGCKKSSDHFGQHSGVPVRIHEMHRLRIELFAQPFTTSPLHHQRAASQLLKRDPFCATLGTKLKLTHYPCMMHERLSIIILTY